jgi:hypothetical protein
VLSIRPLSGHSDDLVRSDRIDLAKGAEAASGGASEAGATLATLETCSTTKVSKERTTSSQYQEQFVEYLGMALQQNQHSVIKPDPRPYQPLTNQQQQTQVPDGGAGWAFVLAAAVTIGAVALVRYVNRHSWNSASRG